MVFMVSATYLAGVKSYELKASSQCWWCERILCNKDHILL